MAKKGVTFGQLILVFVVLAVVAYFLMTAFKPPAVQVRCAPYLAQVYGYEGQTVNATAIVKDSIDKKAVAGVNLYLLEEKPYDWDRVNKFAAISRMIAGATPAGTSDAQGKLVFAVQVPYVDEGEKVYYGILTATGYWSDLYNVRVGFTPRLVAPSEAECINIYKDLGADRLIEVTLTRVLDNRPVKLTQVLVDKIGTFDYSNVTSLGVSTDEVNKEITKSIRFGVYDGYARVEAIEFRRLLPDLTTEGIRRIEVEVYKGTTLLLREVLFDEADAESPLAKDDVKAYNEFNGKDLIVLEPDTSITIKLKVIADTESVASAGSGRLGPGEQFLQVNIKFAHPMETTPATIVVQG